METISNHNATTAPTELKRHIGPPPSGRNTLALLLLFIIATSVICGKSLYVQKRSVTDNLRQTLTTLVESSSGKLDDWLESQVKDSRLFLADSRVILTIQNVLELAVKQSVPRNNLALQQFKALAEPLQSKHKYQDVFVISPDGLIVASLQEGRLERKNQQNHYLELFKTIGDNTTYIIPDISNNPGDKNTSIQIGTPITGDTGSIIGILFVENSPLYSLIEDLLLVRNQSSCCYIFDRIGTLVLPDQFADQNKISDLTEQNRHGSTQRLAPEADIQNGYQPSFLTNLPLTLVARIATAGESIFQLEEYQNYRGVPVVGGWTWHDKLHLGLGFEIEVSKVLKPYFDIRRTLIAALLSTLLFCLLLGRRIIVNGRLTLAIYSKLTDEVRESNKSDKKFKAMLEYTPDGILIINRKGDIVLSNRLIESLFGYSSKELSTMKVESLIPNRFTIDHREHRESYFKNPRIRPMGNGDTLRGRHKSGKEIPVEISLSPVELEGETLVIATIRDFSDRKRVEENIKKSEASLKEAQSIAHVGSWELDIQKNIIFWSDEVYRIFGLVPQEFEATYEAFMETVYPDDRDIVNKAYLRSLETNRPYEITHRLKLKDGTLKHVTEKGKTLYNKQGDPTHSIGTVQDITEQKKTYDELVRYRAHLEELVSERTIDLMDREEFLATITSSVQIGIISIDHNGQVTFWNESAERIMGWTKEEIIGKELHTFIVPKEDYSKHLQAFRQFRKTGKGDSVGRVRELNALRKNGEMFKAELVLSAVKKDNNWHAIGIINDISERKKSEERLRESERKFKSIFNNSSDGILIANTKDHTFHSCNDAMCKMIGYDEEELLGLRPEDIHPIDDLSFVLESFDRQVRGEICIAENIPVQKKNGDVFFADITNGLATIEGTQFIIGFFRDNTERKKTEEQLRHNMEDLRRFSNLASNREQRMIDLKKEVNHLHGQLGIVNKYKIFEPDRKD